MKKYLKIIICIMLGLVSLASISLYYENEKLIFLNSNSFVFIPLLIIFSLMIKKAIEVSNKRLNICVCILTFILVLFEVLGKNISTYSDLNHLLNRKNIIIFIGYFTIIYSTLVLLYKFLENKNLNYSNKKADIKLLFIIWAIILVCYIPYFLTYFPGNLTTDSINQISQSLGLKELNNHHPVAHTLIISIAMNIGKLLHNYNMGVALFSTMQLITMSGIFAFSIYYMKRKNIPTIFTIISLIFYAIYPIHGLYSITMWKDIPFALTMLLFIIAITSMATQTDNFFNSKLKLFFTTIIMILLTLFRNNGIYVLILSLPFFIIFFKKYYKKVLLMFAIVFISFILWKSVVFRIFNIEDGSIREALSVPMQQIARTVKFHSDELKEEDIKEINKFFTKDNIGELYNPGLSDPVKRCFDDKAFKDNKSDFIKLWFKLLSKYPATYIESFLCNSYGYWYPEASHWVVARGVNKASRLPELNLHNDSKLNIQPLKMFDSFIDKRTIPVFSMVFSIGFTFWLVLSSLTYCIYKKQYKLIIIYIPILCLWLTTLASPVFCEFRYIYSLFTCLPILLSFSIINKKLS